MVTTIHGGLYEEGVPIHTYEHVAVNIRYKDTTLETIFRISEKGLFIPFDDHRFNVSFARP